MSTPDTFTIKNSSSDDVSFSLATYKNRVKSMVKDMRETLEEISLTAAGDNISTVLDIYREKGIAALRELSARKNEGVCYRFNGPDLEIEYRDGSDTSAEWTVLFSLTDEMIPDLKSLEAEYKGNTALAAAAFEEEEYGQSLIESQFDTCPYSSDPTPISEMADFYAEHIKALRKKR